jgi:hypothetical protein
MSLLAPLGRLIWLVEGDGDIDSVDMTPARSASADRTVSCTLPMRSDRLFKRRSCVSCSSDLDEDDAVSCASSFAVSEVEKSIFGIEALAFKASASLLDTMIPFDNTATPSGTR